MLQPALLISVLVLSISACFSQTLTSTFTFAASGYIGTPASATTPFQGQTFTNANITITTVGSTANRIYDSNNYCIQNDSASVTIAGVGTYRFPYSSVHSQATVDAVKGITANTIGLWVGATQSALSFCNVTFPNVSVSIPRSSLWDMSSSLGPIQVTSGFAGLPMPTTGGTLQFSTNSVMNIAMGYQAVFTGTPPAPTLTRFGVLSHIAAGGGWNTDITLINTSSSTLPIKLMLHNDDGTALTLPIRTTQQGATQSLLSSSVSADIAPNATLLISTTGDGMSDTSVGWAEVMTTNSLSGFAIFRSQPATGSPSEGTVPLQIISATPTTSGFGFDNTNGFVMGVALVNLASTSTNINATVWDDSGNKLGLVSLLIPASGHTAFVLPNQIPLTSGKRGFVQFQNSGGVAGLGLRFSPFNTFTSIPAM